MPTPSLTRPDLPDPLLPPDGPPVETPDQWWQRRRPQLLSLFEEHVYGRTPRAPLPVAHSVTEVATEALGGLATRKQVTIGFGGAVQMEILLYLPNHRAGPAPVFLGLNFDGNHSIHSDPGIKLAHGWVRPAEGVVDHRPTEQSRGIQSGSWQVERIIERGYGLATIYYGDLDPDFHDNFANGVHALFPRDANDGGEWGAIGAWAWGLSRALDYLETDADVDARRVTLFGHSRLGKAALWAGAQEQRFAAVIANNSGRGGSALSRSTTGESVEAINTVFPHWFCDNFKRYNGRETELPVDQHMLLALIAPRPLYLAAAAEDTWADPPGEFLALRNSHPVFRLLGAEGLTAQQMPPLHQPLTGNPGYHMRAGGHDVTRYDWDRFVDFIDLHQLTL